MEDSVRPSNAPSPASPSGQGHIRTQTHDYYRLGTVTLFAALHYLSGKVSAHTAPRHRHQEWLTFLRKIDKGSLPSSSFTSFATTTPPTNIARVLAWLAPKALSPPLHPHLWLLAQSGGTLLRRNHRKVIRSGSFRSVPGLVADIFRFLEHHNLNPKPISLDCGPQAHFEKSIVPGRPS